MCATRWPWTGSGGCDGKPHGKTEEVAQPVQARPERWCSCHVSPVTITGGLFNVLLGGGAVSDGSGAGVYTSLTQVFRDYSTVWMAIQVGAETLSPRIRILATGYALNSDHLDGKQSTVVNWGVVAGAVHYDVVRGNLAELRLSGQDVDLGRVTCIERESLDTNTSGSADTAIPAPGQAYFYAVQFFDGLQDSSYGSESVGRARIIKNGNGNCP